MTYFLYSMPLLVLDVLLHGNIMAFGRDYLLALVYLPMVLRTLWCMIFLYTNASNFSEKQIIGMQKACEELIKCITNTVVKKMGNVLECWSFLLNILGSRL